MASCKEKVIRESCIFCKGSLQSAATHSVCKKAHRGSNSMLPRRLYRKKFFLGWFLARGGENEEGSQ